MRSSLPHRKKFVIHFFSLVVLILGLNFSLPSSLNLAIAQSQSELESKSSSAETDQDNSSDPQKQVVQEIKDSMERGFQKVEEMKRKFEELSKPVVNILKGVKDSDLLEAIADLFSKTNWIVFWWSQLGAFGLVLVLRLWLFHRPLKWYRRLWIDIWTFLVYL
ncbi:MAG: hypothetical protein KDD35_11325, partial [Bdellovibrionales bacterium]|nr:hypothetical protein [Bdellovibrionales bacterium]